MKEKRHDYRVTKRGHHFNIVRNFAKVSFRHHKNIPIYLNYRVADYPKEECEATEP